MAKQRVSERQAVLLVMRPGRITQSSPPAPGHLSDLELALLRDNLGIAVAVNGVTIGVVAQSIAEAAVLSSVLPHDVELFAPDPGVFEPNAPVWHAMEACWQRAFARIVAIRSDVIGLTVRTVSTALSCLAQADVVTGFTPNGDWYLAGACSRVAIEALRSSLFRDLAEGAGGTSFGRAPCQRGLVVRCVEPLPCAAELHERDVLRAAAIPLAYARTAALLGTG